MDANIFCNNSDNAYLGHGTGTEDTEVMESIMNNGLRCSHGSLYFTTVEFGMGNQIEESISDMLRNWPHKDSKNIIIVSIPLKYRVVDSVSLGTYSKGDAAYYYNPKETDSAPYLMPEFVKGYYDANTDTFINNPKYYENLSQEEQIRLFDKVKENYFDILNNSCGIDTYREIIEDTPINFGLTDEEIIEIQKRKQAKDVLSGAKETNIDLANLDVQTLPKIINPELLQRKMKLPNGREISATQYIQEVVYPHIPQSGRVTLSNGANLSVKQFIEECVIFDCQERYNGDFERYLAENTVNTVLTDAYSDKKIPAVVDDWEEIETLLLDDNDITSSMELDEHMLAARHLEVTNSEIQSAIEKAEREFKLSNMSEDELASYFVSEIKKTTDPERLGELRREMLAHRIKGSDDNTKSSGLSYSGQNLVQTPGISNNQKGNNIQQSQNSSGNQNGQSQSYTYSNNQSGRKFDDSSSKKQEDQRPKTQPSNDNDRRNAEYNKQAEERRRQFLMNELMRFGMDELQRYLQHEQDVQKRNEFSLMLSELEERKNQQAIDEQKQNSGQSHYHGMGM